MDIQKIRASIFEKTGTKIDVSDPVFTIIAMNEAMIEELFSSHQQTISNADVNLDEKIGILVSLQNRLIEHSGELLQKNSNAQLTAALKAATEAKAEILKAARIAVRDEVKASSDIITSAAESLAEKSKHVARTHWMMSLAIGVLSGITSAVIVMLGTHYLGK